MFRSYSSVIFKLGSYVNSKRQGTIIIMSVLLTLSAGVNILYAYKVSSLRKTIVVLRSEIGAGESVEPFIAHSLAGTPTPIAFSDHALPTILYIFSPQCGWCTRNLDNIKAMESTLKTKYRFIGLSMSDTSLEEYIASNNFSFPVYKNPDVISRAALRLGGTPHTLVISQDGKIVKNWHGAYSGDQKNDVEKFFGISLPGVRMNE